MSFHPGEYDDRGDDDDRYNEDWGDEPPIRFADPGGRSALRAATARDPRIHPCPSCDAPNRLTRQDVSLGYQCDACADRAESGWGY
jgi:hypothetical protein